MISRGFGGRGGSFSMMTDRGGGGNGGKVLVTICAEKKTIFISNRF